MKNKALINLSFDDGRIDNYNILYPLLKKYNLSATLNITTGFLRGESRLKRLAPTEPMNVDMVKEIPLSRLRLMGITISIRRRIF